jgi:uncharacterized protein (TIGR03084 family)
MLATVHATSVGRVPDRAARRTEVDAVLDDLVAEQGDLDATVASLDEQGWATPTPAAGWDVRDSIAHLALSEELATLALTDTDGFTRHLEELLADLDATEAALVDRGRSMTGTDVLGWWRVTRVRTIDALRARDPDDRVPWVIAPMSSRSFATARLMETWAHGTDVRDGLGIETHTTTRLRHVAELGVRTRKFAYAVRGLPVPDGDVHVELDAPDGGTWSWGTSTTDVVRGPAIDFCRVVTQRGHPDDTALVVTGSEARRWLDIAQAFAGRPTDPRSPS